RRIRVQGSDVGDLHEVGGVPRTACDGTGQRQGVHPAEPAGGAERSDAEADGRGPSQCTADHDGGVPSTGGGGASPGGGGASAGSRSSGNVGADVAPESGASGGGGTKPGGGGTSPAPV